MIVPANLPASAREIAQSALRHRLPTISLLSQYPDSGGLMSYGASLIDIRRRAQTLGLTVPPSLLLRADRVIE